MAIKLLTEQHLEVLSLKEGCRGLCKSKHVKMPHCLKSRVAAQVNHNPRSSATRTHETKQQEQIKQIIKNNKKQCNNIQK